MFATLLVAAAAAPAAPVPADTNPAPAGPAPWVVHLKADDGTPLRLITQTPRMVKQSANVTEVVNGQQVVKQVIRDVQTVQSVVHTLNDIPGTVTAADGKAVDRAWLRAVGPATVVVAAEALAGSVNPPQVLVSRQAITTPTPRLTLLTAGADGTVRVTTSSGAHAGRYVSGRVMIANGNGAMPLMLDNGVPYTPNGNAPQTRPLSEVGFDAYDLTGRLVAKDEAVRRLRAGGLVLVAADARFPDPAALEPFRGDLLVLVSGEHLAAPGTPAPPAAPAEGAKPVFLRAVPVAPALAAPVPAFRVAPARVLPARPVPAPVAEKPAP